MTYTVRFAIENSWLYCSQQLSICSSYYCIHSYLIQVLMKLSHHKVFADTPQSHGYEYGAVFPGLT